MIAKIFCGLIYKEEDIYQQALDSIQEKFGAIDIKTDFIPFDFTDYYEEEMGKKLKRRFISFSFLQSLENSYKWKISTIEIEKKLSLGDSRQINIDSGYITLSKVVLFSTKNYYHRIYLGEKIYAEVTLRWHNKKYEIFPWTYPDYKTEFAKEFFTNMRKLYSFQIKNHQIL